MNKRHLIFQWISFITGLVSIAGIIIFLNWPGRNSGLEGLARFFKAAAVCLPIIIIPGISSIVIGIKADPEKKFKWWLIPACGALTVVFGFFALLFILSKIG